MLSKLITVSLVVNAVVKATTYYSSIGVFNQPDQIETFNTTAGEALPNLMPQSVNTTVEQMILDSHNYYRSLTALGNTPNYPAATNMDSMVWDPALAATAQAWAEQCIWNHNANRKADFYAQTGQTMWYDTEDIGVGENLYGYEPGTYDPASIVWGIGAWYGEYPNWSYGTGAYPGTCASGTECGHFTQLVWGNSRYVGCGVAICPNGLSGWTTSAATVVVCDYWPPGNYGGRQIYNSASSASDVASECNERHGDSSTGLCDGCYSSYGTQCEWDEYGECTAADCESPSDCIHCHGFCLDFYNSTCSSTCLENIDNLNECTDGLLRSLGTTSTTTTTPKPTTNAPTINPTIKPTANPTTKAPTPKPTTKSPTNVPTSKPTTTTTTTTTTTKAPTPKPTTKSPTSNPTTTQAPTLTPTTKSPTPNPTIQTTSSANSISSGSSSGTSTTFKCCAITPSIIADKIQCGPLDAVRCATTRKCEAC